MEEKTVTSREICAIIRECAKNGVKELSFGTLKIQFGEASKAIEPYNSVELPEDLPKLASQQNLADKDFQDQLLAVTDPIAWEESQLRNEENA